MIKENRLSKYILYAIGEIILVVIGILIALQLNGWKEERQEASLEYGIVKSLLDDISENEMKIKGVIHSDSSIAVRNKALLGLLQDENSTYHDSLQIYFGSINRYDAFFPQRMAYEDLVSKGLHVLKNDSLRNEVIELYDVTYFMNSHVIALRQDLYINSNELFNKRLYTNQTINHKVPIDFNALKMDHEFINNLSHFAAEGLNFVSYAHGFLEHTIAVKGDLRNELQRLEH
jgi:hypothetical protein